MKKNLILSLIILILLLLGCSTDTNEDAGSTTAIIADLSGQDFNITHENGAHFDMQAINIDADIINIKLYESDESYDFNLKDQEKVATIFEVEFDSISSDNYDENSIGFYPQITIPASLVSGHDINTLSIFRVADMMIEGEAVSQHASNLPITISSKGDLIVTDLYFSDSISSDIEYENSVRSRAMQRTVIHPRRIRYVIGTFSGNANWKINPVLQRFYIDPEVSEGRGKYEQLTEERQKEEDNKSITNLVVFVHGHNEEEKLGYSTTTVSDPWKYSYKRDVWTPFYKYLSDNELDTCDCSAYYEFVYPSYRPIFTDTDGVSRLDKDFANAINNLIEHETDSGKEEVNLYIVAHSMGGLVARSGIQLFNDTSHLSFKKLVTWGSPHMGAALVTLRYVMGAPTGIYTYNQASLNYALRRAMDDTQIDAPGTRDLRWANSHTTTPRNLALDDFFSLNPAHIGSNIETKYNLQNGTEIYNENLKLLNTDDTYRLSSKYHALFGVTTKKAKVVDGYWGLWPKFENFDGTPLGALIMWWIMDEGDQSYAGHQVRDSDGAVPIVSMSGAGVVGGYRDVGDADHEEYFNNPSIARRVANWTLNAFDMAECCAKDEIIIDGECIKPEFDYPSAEWIQKASLDDLINKFCPRPNVTGQIKHVVFADGEETYIDWSINKRIGPTIQPGDGDDPTFLSCNDGYGSLSDSFGMIESRGVYYEWHKILNKDKTETLEHGPKRNWYENTHLRYEYYYKEGQLHGLSQEWDENGQIRNLKNYTNGLRDGAFEQYCLDGGKIRIENFKDDKYDGTQFLYYTGLGEDEDGYLYQKECNNILREKATYKMGIKDGRQYIYYDITGELHMEFSYIDGFEDDVICYKVNEDDLHCDYSSSSYY